MVLRVSQRVPELPHRTAGSQLRRSFPDAEPACDLPETPTAEVMQQQRPTPIRADVPQGLPNRRAVNVSIDLGRRCGFGCFVSGDVPRAP
jgi:hypothetical protein